MKPEELPQASNFFLDGNFAPIEQERDATDMAVSGSIPADLKGYFLRIGPNPVHIFSEEAYHTCLLYTSPSPRDRTRSRMPSSA